jgi:hypothetical protein
MARFLIENVKVDFAIRNYTVGKVIGIELEECLTDDDHEFTVGLRITPVRHWREAAALQRRLQARQCMQVSVEYEPELAWAPPPVLADDAEAAVEGDAADRCERSRRRSRSDDVENSMAHSALLKRKRKRE